MWTLYNMHKLDLTLCFFYRQIRNVHFHILLNMIMMIIIGICKKYNDLYQISIL